MNYKLNKNHSKSFLNEFFQKSPTHMIIVNPEDGATVDANKSYLKFYGCSRKQIIGKTAVELGHMDNEELEKILNTIKGKNYADSILVKVKGKKNEFRYVLLNVVPIIVKNKALFLCYGTDISSSVLEAKKQRDEIFKIYDCLDKEGVILISNSDTEESSVLYANKKAKNILKSYSLNKLLKKLKGYESLLLTINSISYHIRKVGKPDSSYMKLIVIYQLPESMHIKQTMKRFNFTSRQEEIAVLALNGHSNRIIAKKLCISEYTVKDHIKDIFRIMLIRNRSELFPKLFNLR